MCAATYVWVIIGSGEHQVITWTSVDFLLVRFNDIHMKARVYYLGQYHTVAMSTCGPVLMLLIPRGVQGIVIAPRTRALSRQLRTNGAQPLIPGAGSSIKLQNIPTHSQVKQASKGCGTRDAAVNVTDCWLDALMLQKFHCYAVQINASSKLLLYELIVSSNRPVSPISGIWSWYSETLADARQWWDQDGRTRGRQKEACCGQD